MVVRGAHYFKTHLYLQYTNQSSPQRVLGYFYYHLDLVRMDDNLSKQVEEIEALCSIYGNDWKVEDESNRSYSIEIKEGFHTVKLYMTLPAEYPSKMPPTYQISSPALKREEKEFITRSLDEIYLSFTGQSMIFQCIEKIRELLQGIICPAYEETQYSAKGQDTLQLDHVQNVNDEIFVIPKIVHGEIIVDRKSVFQGHAAIVVCVDQVRQVLQNLKENKKIANATHNMYAYRILKEDTGSFLQDCEDDGETHAGSRILHLLNIINAKNVLVVVSRWYGGIHLGPDRFRHINNAARQVLTTPELLPYCEPNQKKQKQ